VSRRSIPLYVVRSYAGILKTESPSPPARGIVVARRDRSMTAASATLR
jgi:hypothetical protein